MLCHPLDQALRKVEDHIRNGDAVYFHPIWQFQRGKLNHRGPFCEAFKRILSVDSEPEYLTISKTRTLRTRDQTEYERNIVPTEGLLHKLEERGARLLKTSLGPDRC